MLPDMKNIVINLELIGAICLAIFAIACVVTAIAFKAPWHIFTGFIFGVFAWAFGKESQDPPICNNSKVTASLTTWPF